ncbi:nucleoside diphosphate kinase, partial [Catenaria anguillulae PL171]
TLALLKPDIYADPITVADVHAQLPAAGLELVRSRRVHWTPRDAGRFYAEHKGKFFYDRLTSYMTSGPFLAMILHTTDQHDGGDAITRWREMIGPTHPVKAQVVAPTSLRGQFGLTDTRNSFHGSDSIETAVRELDFFFP